MSMKSSDFGPKVYDDGRTKQAFKDQCDINKILKRAQKTGSLAFAQKYDEQTFGEFEGYDLLEAYDKIERAGQIFAELPSEVRKDFKNDALAFARFASDPENIGKMAEILPAIAEPGPYFPNPVKRADPGPEAAADVPPPAPEKPVSGDGA